MYNLTLHNRVSPHRGTRQSSACMCGTLYQQRQSSPSGSATHVNRQLISRLITERCEHWTLLKAIATLLRDAIHQHVTGATKARAGMERDVFIKRFQGDEPNKRCHERVCLVTNTQRAGEGCRSQVPLFCLCVVRLPWQQRTSACPSGETSDKWTGVPYTRSV